MSIFVQQPHRRVRPLSGLGAFAALHTDVLQQGTGAFLDTDVCDFEALVQRVAMELGMRQQYTGKPELAQHDAAIYAHEIWEAYCPQAQTYVENNYYGSDNGWGWGWSRRRRHHDGHGGGHGGGGGGAAPVIHHAHDMTASSSATRLGPGHAIVPHAAAMHTAPSRAITTPPARAMTLQTRPSRSSASGPMQHASFAPAHRQAQHAMQQAHSRGPSRSGGTSHRMRGLGDGTPVVTGLRPGDLGIGPAVPHTVQPQSLSQVQALVQQQMSSTITPIPGTWDGSSDGSTSSPSSSSAPSFSIEGALPGGVAFLLAGALGLLGASMIFGK